MSPEERELLNRSLTLAEENNKLLHSLVRGVRIQRIMTGLYWLFLITSAVGAYYFIQPYLGDLINVYSSTGDVLKTFQETTQ